MIKGDVSSEIRVKKAWPSIAVSFINSWQMTRPTYYSSVGYAGYFSMHFRLNQRISLAAVTGIEQFENEQFYPLRAEIRGLLSGNDNSGYLFARGGYAIGARSRNASYEGVSFGGGISVEAGWGYRWMLRNDQFLGLSVNCTQQYAHVDYHSQDESMYTHKYALAMLSLKVQMEL